MVTKRKATTGVPPSTAHVVKRARKVGVQRNPAFVWKSREWKVRNKPQDNLEILCHRDSAQYLVVKKIIKLNDDPLDRRPSEVAALDMLPECNRIVKTIAYEEGSPDPDHGLAFFQYYPLGDIYHWKEHSFDRFNFKPIPESYIWRFFIHMAQALAFIQNVVGPNRDSRDIMIHRDIKPKNVLVYYRQGSTYPSFKLHDFGCETRYSAHRVQKASRCGTFEWQPPENPKINTPAAEIWSLGACVHFLAVGKAPIQSVSGYEREVRAANENRHPAGAQEYSPIDRYYAATVPRQATPINLTEEEQKTRGIGPYQSGSRAPFNHQYSDQLNKWMMRTLSHRARDRPTAEQLLSYMVPEGKEILRLSAGESGLADLDVKFW